MDGTWARSSPWWTVKWAFFPLEGTEVKYRHDTAYSACSQFQTMNTLPAVLVWNWNRNSIFLIQIGKTKGKISINWTIRTHTLLLARLCCVRATPLGCLFSQQQQHTAMGDAFKRPQWPICTTLTKATFPNMYLYSRLTWASDVY